MRTVQNIDQFGVVPVNYHSLKNVFEEYRSPEDKIERLETSGDLIRLKRGLYVLSPEIAKEPLSKELIANHLLGPSYISLQSALSYYGLIPERVYLTLSVTTKRAKKYKTPIGEFSYVTVDKNYYPIGIKIQFIENQYSFLIASPEKALCDLILNTKRLSIKSAKGMLSFLENDIRFDMGALKTFDGKIIAECADKTTKKQQELIFLHQIVIHERV
ncbi:MAG TPA: hypothetical protein DCQ50_08305 [Chryseobacterium sp.]|nr:hypothetical protein [Chryseobacterium sp.]